MAEQTATDEAVTRLQTQIKATEAERDSARAAEQKAREDANAAVTARVAADEAAIKNGIIAAQAKLDSTEARYAEALEKGDHVGAAKINREMNEASVELREFNRRDQILQRWKTQQTEALARQRQQPPGPERVTYDPATQAWLDRHGIDGQRTDSPEFQRAQRAHYAALSQGLVEGTPQYFAALDATMGGQRPGAESPLSQASDTFEVDLRGGKVVEPPDTRQDSWAPALPPTRQVPQMQQRNDQVVGGRVRLTPGEVEAARISNPDLWQTDRDAALRAYATEKAKLIETGEYYR